MMKILHMADVHLGHHFASFGPYAEKMREHLTDSFRKAVALAVREKVRAVLVAGDLFDSNAPDPETLALAVEQFSILAREKIPAFAVAGTHDCAGMFGSIYETEKIPGLKPFVTPTLASPLPAGGEPPLYVYGLSARPGVAAELKSLKRRASDGVHVGILHATVLQGVETAPLRDIPVSIEELAALGLDYVALGHLHGFRTIEFGGRLVAAYPGSLEPLSFKPRGPGAVAMIRVEDRAISVEPVLIGSIETKTAQIDAADDDLAQLAQKIAALGGPNVAARIRITGIRSEPLDTEALLRAASPSFAHLVLEDAVDLLSDAVVRQMAAEPTIRGIFIRRMLDEVDKARDDSERLRMLHEALREGLAAFERNRRSEGFR